ncbi:hypothetical protein N7539_008556, partial [Penicillium diatomitis]
CGVLTGPHTDPLTADDRLGVVVDPAQVRLQPSPDDGYAWSIAEPMAFLLKSPLSSSSVKNLQIICKELGHSLEATTPTDGFQTRTETNHTRGDSQTLNRDQEVNSSFTSRIRDLESANSELHDELDCLRTTLEESKSEREDLQVRISDLENEIETMRSQNRSMKGDLTRTANVLSNALQLLQVYQEEI